MLKLEFYSLKEDCFAINIENRILCRFKNKRE